MRVELVGKLEGKLVRQDFHDAKRDTTEAIRLAQDQDHSMKLAKAGDSLVETLEIYVHVETPETFNVTLVDLPGLLAPAPGSDGPATVERIVKKYVNMSGSLLLFIVPTNQDYDTVLGKVIVDPHADKTIYVLTKLDLLQARRGGCQVAARQDRRRNQSAARRGAGQDRLGQSRGANARLF